MSRSHRTRETYALVGLVPLLGLAISGAAIAAYGDHTAALAFGFVIGLSAGAVLVRWMITKTGDTRAAPMKRLPRNALFVLGICGAVCAGLLAEVSWGGAMLLSVVGAFLALTGVALSDLRATNAPSPVSAAPTGLAGRAFE